MHFAFTPVILKYEDEQWKNKEQLLSRAAILHCLYV